MVPSLSAKTMVCCGTLKSRSASTKPCQSAAVTPCTSAWALTSSSSKAVHEKASTWPASRNSPLFSSTSETTGP